MVNCDHQMLCHTHQYFCFALIHRAISFSVNLSVYLKVQDPYPTANLLNWHYFCVFGYSEILAFKMGSVFCSVWLVSWSRLMHLKAFFLWYKGRWLHNWLLLLIALKYGNVGYYFHLLWYGGINANNVFV